MRPPIPTAQASPETYVSYALSLIDRREDDDCWNWQGTVHSSGYGNIQHRGEKWRAHRLIYTLLHGPIPEGLDLDHLCRNRRCVNPNHLEPVTRGENVRRGKALITHCPYGHPYSGDNLAVWRGRDGTHRRCRACERRKTSTRRAAAWSAR